LIVLEYELFFSCRQDRRSPQREARAASKRGKSANDELQSK
jgi:hypothetical protein